MQANMSARAAFRCGITPENRMRLLTWNLDRGRGTDNALELGALVGADLLFLQETRPTDLRERGLRHSVSHGRWGSAIVTLSGSLRTEILIDGFAGWVVGAEWVHKVSGKVIRDFVFSLHAPTSGARDPRGSYATEVLRAVRAIVAAVPEKARIIIGGDFNICLGEQAPDSERAIAKVERQALVDLRAMGFSVAWRDLHPGQALPQTLRWKKSPSIPYHCDGFVLRGFDLSASHCEVISGSSLHTQSDHNAVMLWLRDVRVPSTVTRRGRTT